MINNFLKNPLIKFTLWVFIGLVVCFIGISNVFAYSAKSIYSGVTSSTLTNENHYNYGYITGGGTQGSSVASVNTTVNGVATAFMFYMWENINTTKTYTLVIYFMSNDLLNTFSPNWVRVYSCSFDSCAENSIISVSKNNNSGNSNTLTIRYTPFSSGNFFKVEIAGDNNQPLTGVSNFGIKRVELGASSPSNDIIENQNDIANNIINNNNMNNQNIINNQNQNTQEIIDNITDDNVDSSSWSNFFNNFTTNTFGLTSIVTAPLNLIQSLTSTTCSDLQLPLPYLQNKYLTLPCMSTIYSQYFGNFFTLYQTITYGIIAYWVCVRIFNLVKDFKNPDHDEIEVVDL